MSYASYKTLGKDDSLPKEEEMFNVHIIKSEKDRENIINGNKIVLIDNFTTWCGPCKQIEPHFAKLTKDYLGKAVLVKENAEDGFKGAPKVRGVPCFHFYVNGKYVNELCVTGADISLVKENLDKLCD